MTPTTESLTPTSVKIRCSNAGGSAAHFFNRYPASSPDEIMYASVADIVGLEIAREIARRDNWDVSETFAEMHERYMLSGK